MMICDTCTNYTYDEEDECFYCDVSLDEDDMYRLMSGSKQECPFYRYDNEYEIVRHQA